MFDVLADAPNWRRWMFAPHSSFEREGVPAPGGVGAVRSVGAGPVRSREEIVEYDPPRHLGYTLLSGVPVRGYRADVELVEAATGTTITWSASFDPKLPGTGPALQFMMRATVRRLARSLAAYADRQHAGKA